MWLLASFGSLLIFGQRPNFSPRGPLHKAGHNMAGHFPQVRNTRRKKRAYPRQKPLVSFSILLRSGIKSLLPCAVGHTDQPKYRLSFQRLHKFVNTNRQGSFRAIWEAGYHRYVWNSPPRIPFLGTFFSSPSIHLIHRNSHFLKHELAPHPQQLPWE